MTLKINYLDNKKASIKNKAIFVTLDTKISAIKANFDRSINQKILNFLKKNKDTKENKIISLNQDFDQKLIVILLAKNNNQLESEKLEFTFLFIDSILPISIPFGKIESNEEVIIMFPFSASICFGTYNNFTNLESFPSQLIVDIVLDSLILVDK